MKTLRIVGMLAVFAVAIVAIAMVLGLVESAEAKDTGIKVIASLAIVGVASELILQMRK